MKVVTEILAEIDAPRNKRHGRFCAGLVLWDDKVIEAAPIVKFMKGWQRGDARQAIGGMMDLDLWSADKIAYLVRIHSIVARVRFSTSSDVAQIELYAKLKIPSQMDALLTKKKWQPIEDRGDLPAGIVGRIYRHPHVSAQRHRRTREQLLRYMQAVRPAFEVEQAIRKYRKEL